VGPPAPLDLHYLGTPRVIGAYLLDTDDGPALFDCGPTSSLVGLREGIAEQGMSIAEVRHLLLSHIHLDHAGAAGVLVREHPHLQVHVSAIGAPHLVDPSRLERSARRLYGDAFDSLWGELAPVPESNIHIVGEEVLGLECFPAPGHASHHVCYVSTDGTLYAGDAAGVRLQPARYILPASPPPDIDVVAWHRTIDAIEARGAERLALVHFGLVDDPTDHLERLRRQLDLWTTRVREGASEDEFVVKARAELAADEDDPEPWERAAPLWQSYAGLKRYLERPRGNVKEAERKLDELVHGLVELLGDDVVGVYLHGSLALGSFNPALSDLDLLVLTKQRLTPTQRGALTPLLARSGPVEISFLVASSLRPWRHPAPYDLHFSWQTRRSVGPGEDPDLAAHITVLRQSGVALVGPPVAEVFPDPPWADYEDSLRRDLETCGEHGGRLYAVLSPARIWATLTERVVHSKESGAAWAIERAPEEYRPLLSQALETYRTGTSEPSFTRDEVRPFVDFVIDQLRPSRSRASGGG
jgi:glyoxylase-like metal-dependent hydrolase (beta-lactamase superfamily II)/predicted nucleotidyltransferase